MALTYGFYNAINHDRLYDAVQVSSIFDGIIHDGVYMSIGDKFMVTALSDFSVLVGTGRAWFDHTWSLNDAPLYLKVEEPEMVTNRIDTVILEVNERNRENYIYIVKGTPSYTPTPPTLINNDEVHQYPLANIRVDAGDPYISQANITNRVGTSDCPFVTGVVQSMNIDALVAQWTAEWYEWKNYKDAEFYEWFFEKKAWLINYIDELEKDFYLFTTSKNSEFEIWFNSLKISLDGNAATSLANRIAELETKWYILGRYYENRLALKDSNGDEILASDGKTIDGHIIYVTK